MKKHSKKLAPLALAFLMCASTAVPAFAGNVSYSFSLKTTTSSKGSGEYKDDSDRTAYLKVTGMSKNVKTNFRVRNHNDVEATYVQTVSSPSSSTYYLEYKPGKLVLDKKYYLWANLDQAQTSSVTIDGTWCP